LIAKGQSALAIAKVMVEEWLVEAMSSYNIESWKRRDAYVAQVHFPGSLLATLLDWTFRSLPDEILVGLDIDGTRPVREEVVDAFAGENIEDRLFAGQGFVVGEAHLVNRGDSYSVHHLPEDWTDDMFSAERGSRAGRFTHWLHTHPNAPAIPSEADADAAQETDGVDMILGVEFTPTGPLPWFGDVEGERRKLGKKRSWFSRRVVLGIAPTGHRIHGLEMIAFHKAGLGVNVVLIDEDGLPYGWESIITPTS